MLEIIITSLLSVVIIMIPNETPSSKGRKSQKVDVVIHSGFPLSYYKNESLTSAESKSRCLRLVSSGVLVFKLQMTVVPVLPPINIQDRNEIIRLAKQNSGLLDEPVLKVANIQDFASNQKFSPSDFQKLYARVNNGEIILSDFTNIRGGNMSPMTEVAAFLLICLIISQSDAFNNNFIEMQRRIDNIRHLGSGSGQINSNPGFDLGKSREQHGSRSYVPNLATKTASYGEEKPSTIIKKLWLNYRCSPKNQLFQFHLVNTLIK